MMQAPVAEQPDGHASKQQEKSTKNRLEATLSKELEHHGYNSIREIVRPSLARLPRPHMRKSSPAVTMTRTKQATLRTIV